eukprot:Nk52_evm1s1181 gene=Nk52_evmTU1s1181
MISSAGSQRLLRLGLTNPTQRLLHYPAVKRTPLSSNASRHLSSSSFCKAPVSLLVNTPFTLNHSSKTTTNTKQPHQPHISTSLKHLASPWTAPCRCFSCTGRVKYSEGGDISNNNNNSVDAVESTVRENLKLFEAGEEEDGRKTEGFVGNSSEAEEIHKDVLSGEQLQLKGHFRRQQEYRLRYEEKRRCPICSNGVTEIDWRDVRLLSQFVTDSSGSILPRRKTGVCARYQNKLRKAIKRARHAGIMPNTYKLPEYKFDPRPFSDSGNQ